MINWGLGSQELKHDPIHQDGEQLCFRNVDHLRENHLPQIWKLFLTKQFMVQAERRRGSVWSYGKGCDGLSPKV